MRLTFKRFAPWAALVAVGLPVALVLKDGLSIVRLARETGGRFAEANLDSDIERTTALRWFLARYPESVGVGYHTSVPANWAVTMGDAPSPCDGQPERLQRRRRADAHLHPRHAEHLVVGHQVRDGALPRARDWLAVADGPRGATRAARRLRDGRARTVLVAMALAGPLGPVRGVRWSPWVTWEWRTLLGQPGRRRRKPSRQRSTRSASLTTRRSSEATTRRPRRCARASSRRSTCGAGPPSTATRRCSAAFNTAARGAA